MQKKVRIIYGVKPKTHTKPIYINDLHTVAALNILDYLQMMRV